MDQSEKSVQLFPVFIVRKKRIGFSVPRELFPVFIVRKKRIGFSVPRGWITFWNIM